MDNKVWIGVDPGGAGNFGVAILKHDGSAHICSVDHTDAAISVIRQHVTSVPSGVGVDAPLWWASGRSGLRDADSWIRNKYNFHSRNVQAINSLWGAVLVQGAMFVQRMRECFPNVPVTESHPKAVLKALGTDEWTTFFNSLPVELTVNSQPDHERDALISAISAREGFEGRWTNDLSIQRNASEQNPVQHWLAPVHYFWPE